MYSPKAWSEQHDLFISIVETGEAVGLTQFIFTQISHG